MRSFLLTPLREGRRKSSPSAVFMVCISTHAPAGGATVPFLGEREPDADFYSRPCGRGDARRPLRTGTSATFLLTPLREGRQGADGLLHKDISTFLLTPLREGRPARSARLHGPSISTHAPAGGATRPRRRKRILQRSFLLTPLREGRPDAVLPCGEFELISTHAPAGGATHDVRFSEKAARFLLTPLREGRLCAKVKRDHDGIISTHAPAGGATRCNRDDRGHGHISTHAPAGGATSGAGANGIARSHFYSRPCGRGDAHGRTYGSFRQISTHAPAGGATPPLPGGPTTYSFLLTPLREGRRDVHR